MNFEYKKILIIGDSGRGKTTFAKKLSEKLSIPAYDTDDFFWEIKFSKPNNKESSIIEINKIYDMQCWIMSGGTRHLIKYGIETADIIFYLRFKNIFYQYWAVITRELKNKKPNLKELYKHLIYIYKKKYKKDFGSWSQPLEEMLGPYGNKIVYLNSFKEIDKYLESI